MRLHSILKHALVASVAIFSLQSCDNDDNDYDYSLLFPNALVTVKQMPTILSSSSSTMKLHCFR